MALTLGHPPDPAALYDAFTVQGHSIWALVELTDWSYAQVEDTIHTVALTRHLAAARQACPPEVLDRPARTLFHPDSRAAHARTRAKIATIEALIQWMPEKILLLPSVGRRTLAEIEAALAAFGLSLLPTPKRGRPCRPDTTPEDLASFLDPAHWGAPSLPLLRRVVSALHASPEDAVALVRRVCCTADGLHPTPPIARRIVAHLEALESAKTPLSK